MKKLLSIILMSIFFTISAQAKDMKFAQISEAEFSSNSPNTHLKNIILDINKEKNIEFVVFTGDNIQKPSQKELKAFIKLAKKLECPFYVVLGDKDVNKQKELGKSKYTEILHKQIFNYKPETPNYSFQKDNFVFIVLDGSKEIITGTNGYYKENTISWLKNELDINKENNVIIFQHFPIVPPSKKPSYNTAKPEKYLQTIANYNNIKAIISGHFNINSEKKINGITHITTAGIPYYRIIDIIDYETQNPIIWAELKLAE